MFEQSSNQGVAGFVNGRHPLFLVADDHALALDAHQHFVFGKFEIVLRDHFAILTSRDECRLVHQIRKVCTGETGRSASDHRKINIVAQRSFLGMNLEDALATANVRTIDHHAAIKTAGAE